MAAVLPSRYLQVRASVTLLSVGNEQAQTRNILPCPWPQTWGEADMLFPYA
jgi:hypothetical protein